MIISRFIGMGCVVSSTFTSVNNWMIHHNAEKNTQAKTPDTHVNTGKNQDITPKSLILI